MSPTATHPLPSPRFLLPHRRPPSRLPLLLTPSRPPTAFSASLSCRSDWSRPAASGHVYGREEEYGEDEEEEEEEEEEDEEEEERSLDLLAKFVENVFKKVSKRARKAVRSVLPSSLSTNLVGFAVNGVLVLAFLWLLKAFLEVICTLGSMVFVSILLTRMVWSVVSYLQDNRNQRIHGYSDDHRAWTGAQPVS